MTSHQPRKRFGQHFLHDQRILAMIVAAIAPKPTDNLIEIGPGPGALTTKILPLAERLTAVEVDDDLIPLLTETCKDLGDLTLIHQDILTVDFRPFNKPMRIIGNLPYNISTPILFYLLPIADQITDMHFMLQKEVVDRLAASPGSKDFGRLSVMIQYFCQVDFLFRVPASAFNPPPKVVSAVVRLTPHQTNPFPAVDTKRLRQVVSLAFGGRRKMLRKSLQSILTEAQIQGAGIDPTLRAEQLTVADFCKLCMID